MNHKQLASEGHIYAFQIPDRLIFGRCVMAICIIMSPFMVTSYKGIL